MSIRYWRVPGNINNYKLFLHFADNLSHCAAFNVKDGTTDQFVVKTASPGKIYYVRLSETQNFANFA